MKNFNTLLNELNKFEKNQVKKSRAEMLRLLSHKKYKELGLNKKSDLNSFFGSDAFENESEKIRNRPSNPYLSPRRQSENIMKGSDRINPNTGEIDTDFIPKKRQETLRGMSKKKSADISKIYRTMGAETSSRVYKNIGSQNRRIYQPSQVGQTELEKAQKNLGDLFPKTTTGKLTTQTIPKGKIPKPPIPLKPPKGKVFKRVISTLRKNPKAMAGAFAIGAGIGAINAFRNRKN